MAKVTISIDEDLLEKVDRFADENGMTRSGMLCLAAKQYLQSMEALPSMSNLLKKFSELVGNAAGMTKEEIAGQLDFIEEQARSFRK